MPKVTTSEFAVAPKGTYVALLCEIETKSAMQKSDRGGADRESFFWVWKFRGFRSNDPLRKQVPIEITTGTGLSSKDSALKSLLMSAFSDKSLDELKVFDTDEMIGKCWVLKVGIGEKPNGGEKNVIFNIEASEEDPFADRPDDEE